MHESRQGRRIDGAAAVTTGCAVLAVGGCVTAAHLALQPSVAAIDGFYHFAHAAHYAANGAGDTRFPWLRLSLVGTLEADIWWGFHVLLVPFTYLPDPVTGMRVSAYALTLTFALALWWTLRSHGTRYAGLWVVAFLFCNPLVLFRLLMLRPHVLSVAMMVLVFSFSIRGRGWATLVACLAATWLHPSVSWMSVIVVIAVAVARHGADKVHHQYSPGRTIAFALVGVLLGWSLRPDVIATLHLGYVQTAMLAVAKSAPEPVVPGAELLPMAVDGLWVSNWLFVGAWLVSTIAIIIMALRRRQWRYADHDAMAALLLSTLYLGVAVFVARRAIVEWAVFGCLFIAFLSRRAQFEEIPRVCLGILVVLASAYVPWGIRQHENQMLYASWPSALHADAANWLEANSDPGTVVFARWDQFPPLFFWNRHNRYLGGMDPIFTFAYDSESYWNYFLISRDLVTDTECPPYPCDRRSPQDLHAVLADQLQVDWVLVDSTRNPKLLVRLNGDSRFERARTVDADIIFRVRPGP